MFFALSKTLDLAFSPLAWAILLAAAGAYRGSGRWAHLARWAPLLGAFVLFVFSLDAVSNSLVARLEATAPRTFEPDETYDAVVLLGGVVNHGASAKWAEAAYNDNVERLLATYALLRSGRARAAILSGGRDTTEDPIVESRALERQLVEWGIEPSRLFPEDASRNTRENALFSKRIAEAKGFRSLLIVTSAFHARRSLESFVAVGLRPDVLPVDHRSSAGASGLRSFLPRPDSLAASTQVLRELFGTLVYRLTA